jgi:hypothetical protein
MDRHRLLLAVTLLVAVLAGACLLYLPFVLRRRGRVNAHTSRPIARL